MAKKGKKTIMKALAAPRTWFFDRKSKPFVPNIIPGPHSKTMAVPAIFLLRDLLNIASNTRDMKALIKNRQIIVNGKTIKEIKYPIGLMDVVSIPKLKKHYRIVFDRKGRLYPIEITKSKSNLKLVRVEGKRHVKKSKIQLNLNDGRNLLTTKKDIKRGDSLLIEVPSQKIQKILKFDKGSLILIIKGKHRGEIATIDSFKEDKVMLKEGKEKFEAPKTYAFVVGEKKPEIKVIPSD